MGQFLDPTLLCAVCGFLTCGDNGVYNRKECMSRGRITRGEWTLRNKISGLFLTADEQENGGGEWWVVYMAGLKVFGSPSEEEADKFRGKLHAEVLRRFGLLRV